MGVPVGAGTGVLIGASDDVISPVYGSVSLWGCARKRGPQPDGLHDTLTPYAGLCCRGIRFDGH